MLHEGGNKPVCIWKIIFFRADFNRDSDSMELKGKLFRRRNFSWWVHFVSFP